MKQYKNIYTNTDIECLITIIRISDNSTIAVARIDLEDIGKVVNTGVRLSNKGYVVLSKRGIINVADIVMSHTPNMTTVVDHIDGDKLNNTKSNLRILTQVDNANNRTKARTDTKEVGITLREVGNYKCYRATVSDRVTLIKDSKAKSQTKRYEKQFNINKLGKEKALKQAIAWRDSKRKEFEYIGY